MASVSVEMMVVGKDILWVERMVDRLGILKDVQTAVQMVVVLVAVKVAMLVDKMEFEMVDLTVVDLGVSMVAKKEVLKVVLRDVGKVCVLVVKTVDLWA